MTHSAAPTPVTGPSWFLIPVDGPDRESLLAALQLAVQAKQHNIGCAACLDLTCQDRQHQPHLSQIRTWQTMVASIGRLPATTDDEPMIGFDPVACRQWLTSGAAQQAAIDDGFNSDALTSAAGLEELLRLLSDDTSQTFWRTVAHLHNVNIWRTADNHGVDGGGTLTADLDYLGQRVRLANFIKDTTSSPTAPTPAASTPQSRPSPTSLTSSTTSTPACAKSPAIHRWPAHHTRRRPTPTPSSECGSATSRSPSA